jgi:hypothetical protein
MNCLFAFASVLCLCLFSLGRTDATVFTSFTGVVNVANALGTPADWEIGQVARVLETTLENNRKLGRNVTYTATFSNGTLCSYQRVATTNPFGATVSFGQFYYAMKSVLYAGRVCRSDESLLLWDAPSTPHLFAYVPCIAAAVGPTGSQGPAGATGDQGPPGDTGDTGEQGPQGSQGAEGPMGPQGIQGIQGPQGTMGPQGIQGIQGVQGDVGPTGATGAAAVQGRQIYQITASQNAAGGTATAGYNDRSLTAVGTGTLDGVHTSLSSGNLVLSTAGTYSISCKAACNMVDSCHLTLATTGDSPLATSPNHRSPQFLVVLTLVEASVVYPTVEYDVTIASSTTYKLRHWVETTRSTDGFGVAQNRDPEIYGECVVVKYS